MAKEQTGKVRIVSNGSGLPTDIKITNAETGEELTHVYRAELTFDAKEVPTAILHMWTPVVDVTLDATLIHHCPFCRRPMESSNDSAEATE